LLHLSQTHKRPRAHAETLSTYSYNKPIVALLLRCIDQRFPVVTRLSSSNQGHPLAAHLPKSSGELSACFKNHQWAKRSIVL
jgi:hypothetical protein